MPPYKGLIFQSRKLQQQLRDMQQLCSPFLASESLSALDSAADRLEYAHKPKFSWQIPLDLPLRTKTSFGNYEPDGNGGHNVEGHLSFIWELEKVDNAHVRLCGTASTRVTIVKTNGDEPIPLMCWCFDVGDACSPGTHFHVQIKDYVSDTSDDGSFDVPRFPSIIATPADCLDFLLGELFQDDWPQHQRASHAKLARVRAQQEERVKKALAEQAQALEEAPDLSALMSLKLWKPHEKLFVPA